VPDAPVDEITRQKLLSRMRNLRAQQAGLVRETEMLINWLDKKDCNKV
jgi:hypothetical protein